MTKKITKKTTAKKKTSKKKTTKKKTKTVAKRPRGRPTEYREEFCELLIDHMSTGLSFETFGHEIGVSRSIIFEWAKDTPENKRKYPGFLDAKKEAEDACRSFWEDMGTKLANGNIKDGSSAVWIYNMKCRFPKVWRPKKEIDVNARYERDLQEIESMSAEQLANLAETAAKYLKAKESDES